MFFLIKIIIRFAQYVPKKSSKEVSWSVSTLDLFSMLHVALL